MEAQARREGPRGVREERNREAASCALDFTHQYNA